MSRNALVTIAIGEDFQNRFYKWLLPSWIEYSKRHDIDIVVIDEPIDTSPRARSRSPSWQKCIVHRDPAVKQYKRIAWVDADIAINPNAPNIFDQVEEHKVGAVDQYACPNAADYKQSLERLYAQWEKSNPQGFQRALTPQDYHRSGYGFETSFPGVVQGGVFAYDWNIHKETLEKIYYNYEDLGHPSFNYEMKPLSFELQKVGAVQWIDHKFNALWPDLLETHYRFIRELARDEKLMASGHVALMVQHMVRTSIQNNYFLHFSGGSTHFQLLSPEDLSQIGD